MLLNQKGVLDARDVVRRFLSTVSAEIFEEIRDGFIKAGIWDIEDEREIPPAILHVIEATPRTNDT